MIGRKSIGDYVSLHFWFSSSFWREVGSVQRTSVVRRQVSRLVVCILTVYDFKISEVTSKWLRQSLFSYLSVVNRNGNAKTAGNIHNWYFFSNLHRCRTQRRIASRYYACWDRGFTPIILILEVEHPPDSNRRNYYRVWTRRREMRYVSHLSSRFIILGTDASLTLWSPSMGLIVTLLASFRPVRLMSQMCFSL